jgi:ligand-binding SRPBCC domain-containing protein
MAAACSLRSGEREARTHTPRFRMSTAQFTQWLPVAIEKVFLFFANPENLPRIMPPETGTRLVDLRLIPPPANRITNPDSLAGVGSEIVTWFRPLPPLPFRARWTALITEFEWNHHFADIQKSGPFRSFHHRHQFEAQARNASEGTIVRDIIDYEVGLGILGVYAEKLFVARQFRRVFEYRQAMLINLLG